MTNTAARTGLLVLVLTAMAGCDSAQMPSATAPTTIQPQPTPLPNDHGEYIVDVTLSVVVFEMTPAGRRPVAGVQVWSSEQAMGVTDATGVFRVRPVWVCPCSWAPSVEANMTAIWFEKAGYELPAGLPASVFVFTGGSDGYRDVKIQGDTRLDVELVRK